MNPRPPVDLQADTLVDEIGRTLAAQRQQILAEAAAAAEATREKARAKARRQLRRALADLRAAARQRGEQLEAEIETTRRRQASLRAADALAAAWPLLPAALAARWQDAAARRRWLATLLALAQRRWPGQRCLLRHPPGWDADELPPAAAVQPCADPALQAGFVIEVEGARLDGTPAALLGDRPRVEAALLAALETLR